MGSAIFDNPENLDTLIQGGAYIYSGVNVTINQPFDIGQHVQQALYANALVRSASH